MDNKINFLDIIYIKSNQYDIISMGNKINKGLQPSDINLFYLKNNLNIINLKIGKSVSVPINALTHKKYDINLSIINEACQLNQELNELGVVCQEITHHNNHLTAIFNIPEYSQKLSKISDFNYKSTIITKKEESKIYKYHKEICDRIWVDLSEYCKILNSIVTRKINNMLLEKQKIHKIKILADYYSSGEEGRYLYELGGFATNLPLLKRMILDKLTQESKNTRVKFKELKIKNITANDKQYMKFTVIIKIKK